MTLHQLRIFSAVAKNLNISEAAIDLHVSQPSVSQQLKLLEEEYRVKLYKNTGRGIELTREGRLFLKEAESTLLQVERLKRIFSLKPRESEARQLIVGGSNGPSASFLPRLASIFRGSHRDVQPILRTDSSPVMEQLVQSSDVEIAVITNPSTFPRLVYEPCRQEELVLFASSRRPWAKRQRLSPADLAHIPLVAFRRGRIGGVAKILNQMEERGFHPNIVMHCETAEAVKAAVRTGMGVGILYRDLVEPDRHRGDLKIIHVPGFEMHVDSFIIYPKGKLLSADAADFLILLREARKGSKKTRTVCGEPLRLLSLAKKNLGQV